MAKACDTCIYRHDSPLDLERLEDDVRDKHMGFQGYRECHHAPRGSGVCCRGFWNAHKDEFTLGQIAQRLGVVEYIDESDAQRIKRRRKKRGLAR